MRRREDTFEDFYQEENIVSEFRDIDLIQEWREILDRRIVLNYEIDETVSMISRKIIQFNKEDIGVERSKRKPIYLYIDSNGGSFYDAVALRTVIELSNTPVITVALNIVASAAFVVFLGGKTRLALPNVRFLIHRGTKAVSGDANKVEDLMKEFEKSDKEWEEYLLANTKIDKTKLLKKKSTEWWIDATEALSLGVTTRTIESIDELYSHEK